MVPRFRNADGKFGVKGIEVGEDLEKYVESFRHGMNAHAGSGIGLEGDWSSLCVGLDTVLTSSMIPRASIVERYKNSE